MARPMNTVMVVVSDDSYIKTYELFKILDNKYKRNDVQIILVCPDEYQEAFSNCLIHGGFKIAEGSVLNAHDIKYSRDSKDDCDLLVKVVYDAGKVELACIQHHYLNRVDSKIAAVFNHLRVDIEVF